MVVLGLAVGFRGKDAEVNREELAFLAACVQQVDYADAAHEAPFGSAVLKLDQLDLLGVLLVLDAVVDHQITVVAVLEQRLDDFPQAAGCEFLAAQIVADGIVAGGRLAFEMIGQMGAGIIVGRGNQVFDVLLLRHMLLYAKTQAKVL